MRFSALLAATAWLLTASSSIAQSETTDTKALIVGEVTGRGWKQAPLPNSRYLPGRFYFEGSFQFPDIYMMTGSEAIAGVAAGNFEIIPPTQNGATRQNIPAYLEAQPRCSHAAIRYWNGVRETSQREFNKLKERNSPDITPYFPGAPRPIDYETQFRGLQPYASASANFSLYALGTTRTGGELFLFGAEDYRPLATLGEVANPLEGSFAAFEVPSCRFVGSLDYRTRCLSLGTYKAAFHLTQVIRLFERPFLITVSNSLCEVDGSLQYELFLWDLTHPALVPIIYKFVSIVSN